MQRKVYKNYISTRTGRTIHITITHGHSMRAKCNPVAAYCSRITAYSRCWQMSYVKCAQRICIIMEIRRGGQR